MSLKDLRQLEIKWCERYPHQAKGGIAAIDGFHYQFLIVLLVSVQEWLARTPIEQGNPRVFTEILSDVVSCSQDDVVIITQVKRTQSYKSIRSALDELYLIHKLALAETPGLIAKLEFRILSAQSKLSDVQKIIDRWTPRNQIGDDAWITDFREKVSAQIIFDPLHELLALLANDLKAEDPLHKINSWLGKLISSVDRPFNDEIWNELWQLKQQREEKSRAISKIYVWSSKDQSPKTIRKGKVLVHVQPQVHHLRDGCISPRPLIYNPLFKAATDWLQEGPEDQDIDFALPIFWIQGRSGCGKSFALLHLLSQLHTERFGPILWLGNQITLLPDAIQYAIRWSSQSTSASFQTVIIGLDDPYSPENVEHAKFTWSEAITCLESIRQDGNASALPVIFCCGPTEHREQIEEDIQGIKVESFDLPRENPEDLTTLRDWYRLRTGREPPDLGDENVLVAQLFFEWSSGQPMKIFAENFRRRIKRLDTEPVGTKILDIVCRILALNRLYVGYSKAAIEHHLDTQQYEYLEVLIKDNHLAIDPDGKHPGFWLAHPHLANALYRSWYPEDKYRGSTSTQIHKHLGSGISDSFTFETDIRNKTLPLWGLSRSLILGTEQYNRIFPSTTGRRIEKEVMSLLRSTYETWTKESEHSLTLSLLPVWIEIRGKCFQADLNLSLTPNPVILAVEKIRDGNLHEKGLRLTCHKLIQYFDTWPESERREIRNSIISLLEKSSDWQELHHVAADFISRVHDKRLLLHSEEWIAKAPGTRVWAQIGIDLLEQRRTTVPRCILIWLRSHQDRLEAGLLLREILNPKKYDFRFLLKEEEFSVIREYAMNWLRIWHLTQSANLVIEPLCEEDANNPESEVYQWAYAWLELELPWSNFLIEKLLKLNRPNPINPEQGMDWLLERGNDWLQSNYLNYNNKSWPQTLYTLLNLSDDRGSLFRLGLRWLEQAPLSSWGWERVWRGLSSFFPNNTDLNQLGLRKLRDLSSDKGWVSLWQHLIEKSPDDSGLLELGRAKLHELSDDNDWAAVWQRLIKISSEDDTLMQIGRQRLEHCPNLRLMPTLIPLRVGCLLNGKVRAIKPYGAFVDLDGISGLLHVLEITHEQIDSPESILNVNDEIKVLIVDLDAERGRILLSTKELEPEPGDMVRNPKVVYDRAEEMAAKYRARLPDQQQVLEEKGVWLD